MAWNPLTTRSGALVIDANVAIAVCAKETQKYSQARAELQNYSRQGYSWYAPGVIVPESLHALCRKEHEGIITSAEHAQAVDDFQIFMQSVSPPPNGEASLILRADQIRGSYGCSRSADALYIALAEELSQTYTTRLLTFDQGLPRQAAQNAPLVNVHLLT